MGYVVRAYTKPSAYGGVGVLWVIVKDLQTAFKFVEEWQRFDRVTLTRREVDPERIA